MPEAEKGLIENRKDCYRDRDLYFDCLEKNNEDGEKCQREYRQFANQCHASWVQHFIRKRGMQKYKKVMAAPTISTTTFGNPSNDRK